MSLARATARAMTNYEISNNETMTNDEIRMTKEMRRFRAAQRMENLGLVIRHSNFVIVSLFEISLFVIDGTISFARAASSGRDLLQHRHNM
jgi:hypothetical protein